MTVWKRWMLVLLGVGIGWRLVRYLLQFPIWGDEAYVCLNLHERGYLDLIRSLAYNQAAPILFLWGERTALHWLGDSELALRLLALVCGCAALLLFTRLARITLAPGPALLAVGLLAVSYFPVRHACEVKPYAGDLLVSVALLTVAAGWLRQPHRPAGLLLLTLLLPIALGLSYPSVFVAGGISLALLAVVWKQQRWVQGAFLLFNLVLVVGFLVYYPLQSRVQIDPESAASYADLQRYWSRAFPPNDPLAWPVWLLEVHTGWMFAYPVGGPSGRSVVTLLLVLIGIVVLWHSRQRQWLGLLLAPFVLTLVAAALHRYPYGGSARVAQHLAPAICLLAAVGLGTLVQRLERRRERQQLGLAGVCGLLLLVGVAGLLRDLLHPYKTAADTISRELARNIVSAAAGETPIVLLNDFTAHTAELHWYLVRRSQVVITPARIDWQDLAQRQRLISVQLTPKANPVVALPTEAGAGWVAVERRLVVLPRTKEVGGTQHVQVAVWQRAG